MAIAYVGGQVAGRANPASAVSVNYALTGGLAATPSVGDFVIVTCVTGGTASTPMAVTTPAMTALGLLYQNSTADTSLDVSYKFLATGETTSLTIPGTGNNAFGEAYAIQVWRGVSTASPMDAAAVSAGTTGTGRPDPAAITPVTAGAVVVICGGGAAGTGANYTAPTNYTTNFLTAAGADTTDAMVGMGYWTGWTSGAENPGAYTGGTTGATDTWASYTLALRPEPAAQTLTPSLFTSATGAFYAATVAAGAVALTAALFTNSNSFHAATVTPGAVGLTAGLFTNSEAFYTPTVDQPAAGAQDLTPTRVDGSQTFYGPTVGVGAIDLAPALETNSSSFYAATVAPGAVGLTAALAENTAAFYAPTVAPGEVALTAARADNTSAFYAPVVSADGAEQALTADLATNEAVFYAATVAQASAGGGFPWRRRQERWHIEVDGERYFFDTEREALAALEAMRPEVVEPKPVTKAERRKLRIKKSQQVPTEIQVLRPIRQVWDDEDDVELLLLAA